MTHPHPKRSFVPQAVLTRSGKLSTVGVAVNTVRLVNTANTKAVNTVRSVNTAASKPIVNHPRTKTNAFKRGYSQSSRPFNRHFANKNSIINTNVNTARVKHTTARDRAVVSENKGKGANAIKASACWVWKAKNSSASTTFKKYSYIDARGRSKVDSGCSRHMTGNKCYLDEYEDYDGGFVSFGDGKGIIFGKGKIKTGSLDFDDVYFCKELKYNLFSVSQICDKKNNVLFTDTECLVLSSNFKLLDKSQVLLRVPRTDNIYSVDLKSVVPTEGLTCLIAKATIDESNTWHRRLGHINFKTMNKLVKGNLVKVAVGNKTNGIAGTKDNIVAGQAQKDKEPEQEYILIPLCITDHLISQGPKDCEWDAGMKPTEVDKNEASDKSGKHDQEARSGSERLNQREIQTEHTNSSNGINNVSTPVSTAGPSFDTAVPSTLVNTAGPSVSIANESEEQLFERFSPFKNAFTLLPVPNISSMDNTGIFGNAYDNEDVDAELKDRRGGVCLSPPVLRSTFPDKVYKKSDGIFISQDKYVAEILKKFDFTLERQQASLETKQALIKDEEVEDVDVHLYRSMIGSLMYLTASRPDIMFAVCACASDYARASLDRKSTTGGCQFLGKRLISWQCKKQTIVANSTTEAEYVAAANCCGQCCPVQVPAAEGDSINTSIKKIIDFLKASSVHYALTVNPTIYTSCIEQFWATAKVKTVNDVRQIQALIDKKKLIITESSIRSDFHLEDAGAEVAHDETEHEESVPTPSNDPLPNGEDSMQLNDLMVLCTKLQKQVLDLEKAKSDQAIKIVSLKKRVDKLEKRRKSNEGLKIKEFGAPGKIESSIIVWVLRRLKLLRKKSSTKTGEAVTTAGVEDSAAPTIPTTVEVVTTAGVDDSAAPIIPTTVEETLAQTLMEIKAAKPKAKGITKEKGIIQEPERPLTKKDQVALDEDLARNIQAQLDAKIIEEERFERQKQEEANIALIESWESTQAMMEADRLLAERLQTREREELTDEEKGKLFMELMEKRRKHFAALRAQEKRNRSPTKAQKRSQMSTYLKHMGGYKHKQLIGKSYDEIQKLFDKEMKRKAKSSRKKSLEVEARCTAGIGKKHLVIKNDDDIAIDAIPLATKPPIIVEYKLLKEGIMVHFQLIRANGSSKRYSSMIRML
ncbi:ribonuclease H-like domain-containing protein [Tanacetum coccineum]